MRRRLRTRIPEMLVIALVALVLRLAGGPGAAYMNGIASVSDEAGYLGEGFYLAAAISGENDRETLFSQTPPLHQLVVGLAPLVSPFRLVEQGAADPPRSIAPELRSPDGARYTIAYLPAGSPASGVEAAIEELFSGGEAVDPLAASRVGRLRPNWIDEVRRTLEAGRPAILSILSERHARIAPPHRFSISHEPRLEAGPEGLRIIDGERGDLISILPSDGVSSVAAAVGGDEPLSISLATIDHVGVLRIWRFADILTSPWRLGSRLGFERRFEAGYSIAASPSGDLLLASVKEAGRWKLLTIETASSYARIGETDVAGPLRLAHLPEARQTMAVAPDERTFRVGGGPIEGARAIVAVVGAIGALLAWLTGRRLAGRRAGLLAGLLFAVDPLGVAMGRIGYQDQVLATMVAGAAASIAGAALPASRHRRSWFLFAGLFGGLAAATKGFGVPVALFALYLGAIYLPRTARRVLAASAAIAGAVALFLCIGAGASALALGSIGLVALSVVLFARRGEGLGFDPVALVVLGVTVGYVVPWSLRAMILSSAGFDFFDEIVAAHLTILSTGSQYVGDVSVWWFWPSGLAPWRLAAIETGGVTAVAGIVLASALASIAALRRFASQLLALLLILLWVSWAIPERTQMPYYGLPAAVIGGILVVLASREAPRGGAIAIPIAILAPLLAGLAFQELAGAVLRLAVAFAAAMAAGALAGRFSTLPFVAPAIAWPVAVTGSIAAAAGGDVTLALLAGVAAGVAGSGGWRPAPWGLVLAGLALLAPEVVALTGVLSFEGPRVVLSFGANPQLHPFGIALALLVLGLLVRAVARSRDPERGRAG